MRYLFLFLCLSTNLLELINAQPIFSEGRVELKDGSIRSGQLALKRINKTRQVILLDKASKTNYQPSDLKAVQIGDEHFISRNVSALDTHYVLLQQLVTGPVALYQLERSGGTNLLLLDKDQILTTLNPRSPAATLKTFLTDCSSLSAQVSALGNTVSRRHLAQYVLAYNRCVEPAKPTTSFLANARSVQVTLNPRIFLSTGSYKLQSFDGSLTTSSTSWVQLGYGVDLNLSWHKRLSAGLTVAYTQQEGRWNLDQTASLFVIVDKISEQSLFLNPYLRYEFTRTSRQVISPYLTVGFVFNKLLSGQMIQSSRVYAQPVVLTINKEAGLDESGFSGGAGVKWRITSRLAAIADVRAIQTKALNGYQVEIRGIYARLRPINSSLLSSLGVSYRL
ncbi:autotransporter outer membrane beta-barrel domain-containing protein [Spirosoma sp. KUDC1026]|uniref:autotransporter outer membrane beta-barrel domain-containing protein n=1 Tax=Spirosoma sp. KUDC1026 TaxID=2745947 RepID=UPI00159BB5FE|nr:autotransporter outer membrane beta-barrel domain-containing protein [Spirosoma sp. KUDC1026]QKZ13164.1 autotransporter outer membrane beta-barrel domain-containing protein [Spirosoma sp. KUDC1026]